MKLSVGVVSADDLMRRQQRMMANAPKKSGPWHVTRMFPRRSDEILAGGSLYWVIGGAFSVRQTIAALTPVTAEDGTRKCRIELAPEWILVEPLARRSFQGWRYLDPKDAPKDVSADSSDSQKLYLALSQLGLL